ncbi:hypothetical protein NCS52_01207300 [Fusarium sp. LHS14.1]|nr:hypothetical protein NCS52_01207300 [Fusarium sp. LHS14.1]
MKAPVVSLAFAALALCGRGYAGPCIPQSSGSTTDATASTSTTLLSVTDSSSAESSSTDLSSTSADISSSTEILTTSTTLSTESTTSVASTTTTTSEKPEPTNVIVNTSFDEPDSEGQYTGAPWVLSDSHSIKSGSINSNPAFSRSFPFFAIVVYSQRGRVAQTLDLVPGKTYDLS